MKTTQWMTLAVALCAFTSASAAPAKGQGKAKAGGPYAQVFAKYDLDHNGRINVDEGEAMKKDLEKNPSDPILKPLDTNHDGKLSDDEIMAIGGKKAKAKIK